MLERRVLIAGAVVWAAVGLVIGLASLSKTNPDARFVVGAATLMLPIAAVLAGMALSSHRDRIAGVLLLVSVATPTYFAWVVNVPALLVGSALLVVPALVLRHSPPSMET